MCNYHTYNDLGTTATSTYIFLAIFLRWLLYTLHFKHHWNIYYFCLAQSYFASDPFSLFFSHSLLMCWRGINWFSQHPQIVNLYFSVDVTTHRATHSAVMDSENGNCHCVCLGIILMRFSAFTNSCPEVQCQIEMLFV